MPHFGRHTGYLRGIKKHNIYMEKLSKTFSDSLFWVIRNCNEFVLIFVAMSVIGALLAPLSDGHQEYIILAWNCTFMAASLYLLKIPLYLESRKYAFLMTLCNMALVAFAALHFLLGMMGYQFISNCTISTILLVSISINVIPLIFPCLKRRRIIGFEGFAIVALFIGAVACRVLTGNSFEFAGILVLDMTLALNISIQKN